MGKIRILSETLANQIAAGEVVERPASVVKELVENSIDALSHSILIEIIEAGIDMIRVTDDGEGMDSQDLELAFLPHATSKLLEASDLFAIQSLGFRGEALASIGSVAKVYVESTLKNHTLGNFIEIAGSTLIDKGETKAKQGTSIKVESLFYNTPARLKHLKSLNTELKHILNFVQNIALAYPNIKFTLMSDHQIIFQSIGNGQLQQAIATVYQPRVARDLIAIEGQDNNFSISGYISPPTVTRTNQAYIHWIVNGRPVRARFLNEVLIRSFKKQLMVGRYPISVIHIELDPRLVDVNVHPTKQTIRLSLEDELSQLIKETVQRAFDKINPIPNIQEDISPTAIKTPFKYDNQNFLQDSLNYSYRDISEKDKKIALENSGDPFNAENGSMISCQSYVFENNNQKIDTQKTTTNSKPDFKSLDYIGQIHGTYLIASSDNGFYLIDQHAAQEKIRYETFMKEDYKSDQQILLMPELISVSPSQEQAILLSKERLDQLGIELNSFGPQVFQIESYPTWLQEDNLESQILDVCEFVEKNPKASVNQIIEESLIMQSCRGAIKANHYLSQEEARALIYDLARLEDPYHCPHGRPILVHISNKMLEKWFKRVQDHHVSRFEQQF